MNPLSISKKLIGMAGELRRHPQELPYAWRWLNSLLPGHSPLDDEVPWITFRAIDWLDAFLTPTMSVFEYGAGGSTLYLAKRAGRVVSVEHDKGFYGVVQQKLAQRGAKNCELLLHEPLPCDDEARPFASYQPQYRGLCFESYVKAIDPYPDASFDLVLVDGRARVACVRRARSKVKPGGALLLDNSDRPSYAESLEVMRGTQHFALAGVTPWNLEASETSIWKFPHA